MNGDYQGLAGIHIKDFRGVEKYLTGVRGNQTSKQSVEAKLICEHQLTAVEKNSKTKKGCSAFPQQAGLFMQSV